MVKVDSIIHLGLEVKKGKYGYKFNKNDYAKIDRVSSFWSKNKIKNFFKNKNWVDRYRFDSKTCEYTIEWCKLHRKNCLDNLNININYFNSISKNEFNNALKKFLNKYPMFKKINDLSKLKNLSGYYIMVLDEYKQVYIGISQNIAGRIRRHWQGTKKFDRLIWPSVKNSVLSIDIFKPLDTTRVYAYLTNKNNNENKYIMDFGDKYTLNRINGGPIRSLADVTYIKVRNM